MTATIKKDTRAEANFVGAFLRAVGVVTLFIAVMGGIILAANSRLLAGFELVVAGVVGAAGSYGLGLLLKMGVERD
jgi:hypothetical protein